MPQILWRASMVLALHRNRDVPQSWFMQLATVRADGRPANRTVVFRGFLADSHQIIMVSDVRSAKFKDFTSNCWAELCWYFSRTREQFRLAGRVISSSATRRYLRSQDGFKASTSRVLRFYGLAGLSERHFRGVV
ncbi:MAG: pyridoxamine 5'-phosphate oxidase family protein, partial [Isosphaeraceae bacterium]